MEAIELFLHDHARVHSAAVADAEGHDSIVDNLLAGLSEAQIRQRPRPDLNSLAWLLWHMARCEDVALGVLVAGQGQELDTGNWLPRLAIGRRDIGTGMTQDEVADLNARIDVAALRAYRDAVGRRTRALVQDVPSESLREPVPARYLDQVLQDGVLGSARATWVAPLWAGKTRGWFLWLGAGHNYWHLGEGFCVRSQLGMALEVDGGLCGDEPSVTSA